MSVAENPEHYNARAIAARLAQREIDALIDNMPKDTYEDGTVLVILRQFKEEGPMYTYAAVKGGGSWFVTGRNGEGAHSWAELMGFAYAKGAEGVSLHTVSALYQIA